jgi:H+/Cl- antiporter ClcA
MPFRWDPREHIQLALYFLRWLVIGLPVGALVGSAVALFLSSLERATEIRWSSDIGSGLFAGYPLLLLLLPLAGAAIAGMYQLAGKSVEAGNNLIVDQIHEPGGGVPGRMAPLVLIGTVVTHLFGGSAGREGTAIQMGGSIASQFGRLFGFTSQEMRTVLMCGVAAGFGAVFGTPLTGAIFAVEVLAIGLVDFQSIVPCLIASIAGDRTTRAWGIVHTAYSVGQFAQQHLVHGAPDLSAVILAKVAVAAIFFGLASVLFAELTHGLGRVFRSIVPWAVLRPVLGGIIVIGLALAVGTDYLGLGVRADPNHPAQVCIVSCFHAGGATSLSWWWKTLFTAITLSSGFKGGEVTPLFFIGAALGNWLAGLLGAPVDLFAALGFVAVFAGATNTPLACTIMGIELFSSGQSELARSGFVIYLATACFVSYLFSGHSGVYLSQRIGSTKGRIDQPVPGGSLRAAREGRPRWGASWLDRQRTAPAQTDSPEPQPADLSIRADK